METIAFTLTLSGKDWDQDYGGWRCGALKIPGAKVENIYVAGGRQDPNKFEVLPDDGFIRWHEPQQAPQQIAVSLRLKEELSTKELTLWWKKLAVTLPLLSSIAAAMITAGVAYSIRPQNNSLPLSSPVGSNLVESAKNYIPLPTPTSLPKESPSVTPTPLPKESPSATPLLALPTMSPKGSPSPASSIKPTAKPTPLVAHILVSVIDQYGEKYPDVKVIIAQGLRNSTGKTHVTTGAYKSMGWPCDSNLTISCFIGGIQRHSEDVTLDCSRVSEKDLVFPKTIRLER